MSVNKAILVGNLGSDPLRRTTSTGSEVANLTLATSDYWVDKDTNEKKEKTEWHRVSIFGPLATIATEKLSKGSKVFVEGKIRTQKYEDKSGITRWSSEIVANHIEFVDKKNESNSISIKEETLCNLTEDEVPF